MFVDLGISRAERSSDESFARPRSRGSRLYARSKIDRAKSLLRFEFSFTYRLGRCRVEVVNRQTIHKERVTGMSKKGRARAA